MNFGRWAISSDLSLTHWPRDQFSAMLSQGLLATLWEQYDLPQPLTWHRTSTGITHVTWILSLAGNNAVVLRRYHPSFDEAAIRHEHSILTSLHQRGFPVPGIIPAADGSSFVRLDGGRFTVFEYCEGSPTTSFFLRRLQPNMISAGATLLAWYHKLMEGFTPDGKKVRRDGEDRPFVEHLDRLSETVMSTGTLRRTDRYFLQQLPAIRKRLLTFSELLEASHTPYPETIIHGDFGPSHLLVHHGRITAVLDFANAHLNMRVADVGRSLVEFSKGPGPWLNPALARTFLRAYQAGNPLQEDELGLLPEWMIRWRLISIYYALKRYFERRQLNDAARFIWSLKLVEWLQANRGRIRRMWTDT